MLLLAAAQQTGLLEALVEAVMALADPTIPGLNPPNPSVIARLLLTLLFLPVAGLARTWDLRSGPGRCGRGNKPVLTSLLSPLSSTWTAIARPSTVTYSSQGDQ